MKNAPALTVCFDTNLLIYAFTPDDDRHTLASRIVTVLSGRKSPLPEQVLREFLAVAHRKKFMPGEPAREVVGTLSRRFEIIRGEPQDIVTASSLAERYQLQYYDALICVVAGRAGTTVLLTQDMQDGFRVGGLTIIDPFAPRNARALEQLIAA